MVQAHIIQRHLAPPPPAPSTGLQLGWVHGVSPPTPAAWCAGGHRFKGIIFTHLVLGLLGVPRAPGATQTLLTHENWLPFLAFLASGRE